jgi:hypothetical protein
MLPCTVVKQLNVSHHISPGLGTREVRALGCPFPLHAPKETLGDRIVQAIALATHATPKTMSSAEPLKGLTGVLTAAITMMQQTGSGLTTPQGHL